MPDISTILILTHFNPDLQRYFVGLVAKEWETRGIRVFVHRGDLNCSVSADVCFVHVDLSVVPPHYIEFASQYPNTINLHITDIRKTSYSRNRVIRGDGYDGPIIVKSSLNSAGLPERLGAPEPRLRRIWGTSIVDLVVGPHPVCPFSSHRSEQKPLSYLPQLPNVACWLA
jgi:hypothetical protein